MLEKFSIKFKKEKSLRFARISPKSSAPLIYILYYTFIVKYYIFLNINISLMKTFSILLFTHAFAFIGADVSKFAKQFGLDNIKVIHYLSSNL